MGKITIELQTGETKFIGEYIPDDGATTSDFRWRVAGTPKASAAELSLVLRAFEHAVLSRCERDGGGSERGLVE